MRAEMMRYRDFARMLTKQYKCEMEDGKFFLNNKLIYKAQAGRKEVGAGTVADVKSRIVAAQACAPSPG